MLNYARLLALLLRLLELNSRAAGVACNQIGSKPQSRFRKMLLIDRGSCDMAGLY